MYDVCIMYLKFASNLFINEIHLNKGCTYLCTEYTPIPILDITHAYTQLMAMIIWTKKKFKQIYQ